MRAVFLLFLLIFTCQSVSAQELTLPFEIQAQPLLTRVAGADILGLRLKDSPSSVAKKLAEQGYRSEGKSTDAIIKRTSIDGVDVLIQGPNSYTKLENTRSATKTASSCLRSISCRR